MKLKVDENLPAEATELLKAEGFDAESVREEGLEGSPDPELAETTAGEGRIILTLDRGFADITAYPPGRHPGIVLLRPADQYKGTVLALIKKLCLAFKQRSVAGSLWIVEPDRIRIRGPV